MPRSKGIIVGFWIESAFKALVRQAVALNSSGKSKPSKKAKS